MPVFKSTQRANASLRCDAALLYEILTDYDGYVEWLPRIAQSKALATEGDLAIAEFHTAPKKQRFVVECIHTRNRMVLWRTIEGNVSVAQVEWNIEPAGEGQCRVSLAVERAVGWKGLITGKGRLLDAPAALQGLERQVASFLPEIAISDDAGEKILELSETEDGVVCWIRGKKYVLKEAATN